MFRFSVFLAVAAFVSAQPPQTKRVDHTDVYHGVRVADPYRWLEDPDSPESRKWIEAQNRYTRAVLDKSPGREALRRRLAQFHRFDRFQTYNSTGGVKAGWIPRGDRVFTYFQDGSRNQPVLSVREKAKERALLDPNLLSKDGTSAINNFSISRDGEWLAYAISEAGSDWQKWRIRGVASGRDLEEVLEWSKFSSAEWDAKNEGFYYGRYPAPVQGAALRAANDGFQLWYHKRGTPQSADRLVYERPDQKRWFFEPAVTRDGAYLVLEIREGTSSDNRVYIQDLAKGGQIRPLIDEAFAEFAFRGNQGSKLLFKTTWQAPRGRVIEIDLSAPERTKWREVVAESGDALDQAMFSDGLISLLYLHDVAGLVKIAGVDGKIRRTVPLPANSTVTLVEGATRYYGVAGFGQPMNIYDCPGSTCSPAANVKQSFDPSILETKQVFYESTGGVKVPMFIVMRKGAKMDGNTPAILYGYGGFNVSITPAYNPSIGAWVERGGIYAVANLRGGAEYGDEWHRAGMKQNKQNVFDDFIKAAEWLIANKYTSPKKLAILGGSNGGLLVGAVLNQRPELFGAAVPAVGVMDMLRFDQFTIGAAWASDYGSPKNEEDFRVIYKYSPLHNIRKGAAYPATMVMTADHDDRVVPAHSFKYAAALQAAQGGSAPILIRIETSAGHGAGKPTTKKVDSDVDLFTFLDLALGSPGS
jgi:prolyl oligopeptidase